MTKGTNDEAPLPPIAWIRETPWGRDVTAYARDQDHRIADLKMIAAMENTSPNLTTVEAIVLASRYRTVMGSVGSAGFLKNKKLSADEWDGIIVGRYNESEIAMAVCTFIMEGSRIIALGPKLVAETETNEDMDLSLAVLTSGGPAFYVRTEGTTSLAYDGLPLDGFLVSFEDETDDDEEEGQRHLHVTPMSRGLPVIGEALAPTPTMCLSPGEKDERISDVIRTAATRLLLRADAQATALADAREEDEEQDMLTERRDVTTLDEIEAARHQADLMDRNADCWARLIGMSLSCLVNRGPEAVSGFPPEAPTDLVERAQRGSSGARKAEQRLVAAGFPRWTRYETGVGATDASLEGGEPEGDRDQSVPETIEVTVTPLPEPVAAAVIEAPALQAPKGDRRRERRLERLAREAAAKTAEIDDSPIVHGPTADDAEPAIDDGAANEDAAISWTPTKARHDPDLLTSLDATLRRCFKDLPSLESRNWEAAFPPALASMVMRRARVKQLPRETTSDATRRRLAADIRPRLEELPQLLQRLRTEEAANGERIRAYRIERASVQRDVDHVVTDGISHPVLVSVTADEELAGRIMFAGVERDTTYVQDRTVVVRAWRVERTLHLMGIVHDGCLVGFRRLEHDLDDGTTTLFDADGDDGDADALLDALYAPVADAILGPIEETEAWRYQRRARQAPAQRNATTPSMPTRPVDGPSSAPAEVCCEATDDDFISWETVSRVCPSLGGSALAHAAGIMDTNAVARAVLRTLDHDGDAREVRNALTRHLSSWRQDARLDTLTTPTIADDVDLMATGDRDGVIVVNDVALFEHASPGLVTGPLTSREAPLCILYRLRADGLAVLIIRPTSDNLINMAQWIRVGLEATDDESDLAWYVRGAVSLALGQKQDAAITAAVTNALPGIARRTGRADGSREGPRRIVAQARIRPTNMHDAATAAATWFDAQVARHGSALIEDRRLEGDWTIEHSSMDRGVGSHWSVTLHAADDDQGALDIFVRTTLATGVKPRLPTLLREIAAATPTDGPDGRLVVHPRTVRTRSDLNELLRHLQSGDRQLPTLVMTQDRQGQYARDPGEIARQALGAMNVWLILEHMTYELADTLGQEYRTFGGAARMFQPRFDPDVDPASRHPRIMNDTGVDRALAELISRATAATTTRYNIPDPLSPATMRVKAVVVEDEPKLPFANEPLTAREALPAPTATISRPEPVAASTPVPAVSPDRPVPPEGMEPEPDPDPVVEVEADEAPLAIGANIEPASGPERIDPQSHAGTPPDDDAQDSSIEGPTLDNVAPVASPTEPPATQDQAQEQAAVPPAHAAVDIDQIVAAVDLAVARRLGELGIAGLTGTVTSLVERVTALSDAASPLVHSAEIETRDVEIQRLRDEMRSERETTQELLTEAEAMRQSAVSEVETLRQALNEMRRGELRGASERQWPADLSGLADWLEGNVLPNIVITPKAWRAMRKVRYTDMERLCTTLQLLDGAYIDMRAGEDGARQRWEEGLKTLRLDNKKQSQMGKGIRGGNEYRFEHEGTRWDMEFHLRGLETVFNEHDRLLRIYYAYDKERGRVLIGHMPTHLTTIDS